MEKIHFLIDLFNNYMSNEDVEWFEFVGNTNVGMFNTPQFTQPRLPITIDAQRENSCVSKKIWNPPYEDPIVFGSFRFPVIRNIFPTTIAHKLISVQPMAVSNDITFETTTMTYGYNNEEKKQKKTFRTKRKSFNK